MPALLGCYGLRFTGVDLPAGLLVPAPLDAPCLEVRVGPLQPREVHHGATRLPLVDGEFIYEEEQSRAHYVLPVPPDGQELVHPYLAQAAINKSLSLGRLVLHGGVVGGGSGAVAVLGLREAGKSTLMARAALRGLDVLTDDVVVLEGELVYTGPRCIDLRPGTVRALPIAASSARGGTRWRMELPESQWSRRLAALVVLDWGPGPEVDVERLSAHERLAALEPHLACQPTAAARRRLLDLAAVPTVRIRRPRDFRLLDDVLDCIVGLG